SSVHPEAYPVVERILDTAGKPISQVIGDRSFLNKLQPGQFTDDRFGIPTVTDIIAELEKPGRDPRGEFKTASFQEGVEELSDLKVDMILEGVVTNVTNFGAFVDVGVHQDGLVHISAMSDKFIKDPREVVKAGDLVKVKVMEVDLERRRIALSMRLNERGDQRQQVPKGARPAASRNKPKARKNSARKQEQGGAMAAAFANALKR
ncbi:MAG: S1 RNA-binding domain-containing protein, partial [Sedimenticola sp.]